MSSMKVMDTKIRSCFLRPYIKLLFLEFQKNKLTILLFPLRNGLIQRFCHTTPVCLLFWAKKYSYACK